MLFESNEFTIAFDKVRRFSKNFKNYQLRTLIITKRFLPCNNQQFNASNYSLQVVLPLLLPQ